MTITELIEALEEMLEAAEGADPEVRMATQPSYPLQTTISAVTMIDGKVFIAEGGQPYDDPYAPRKAWEGGVSGIDFDYDEEG